MLEPTVSNENTPTLGFPQFPFAFCVLNAKCVCVCGCRCGWKGAGFGQGMQSCSALWWEDSCVQELSNVVDTVVKVLVTGARVQT